ncbi:LbetaH domain-containing protein [Methylomonas rapida]|uniref:Colanic acid biosynthesis acetyltransferase n=1 Tax=Methylomonas rapida TaxID=2963939 RepID=A0ABY7GLF1_9GAMM|nr:putative colanic acid biosynthesis acetyltransferase [Methylomonas rapida]WAR45340.1 putative colanic acid biosynthesis acetyltransferase [Methylomonas rapida]
MLDRNRVVYQKLSKSNKLTRIIWNITWLTLYRPSPIPFHFWRRFLLRLFGATIEEGVHPYPSAKIWAPWNLIMRKHSCLSHYVDCYSVDKIELGIHVTVSQYSYLCSASHDYTRTDMPLITAPIKIGNYAWVTADVFVGPGVTIGEGAVVGARSTVIRNVPPWTVVAGNPATPIKQRILNKEHS